jgi:chemotaxis protein MotB
MSAKGERPIVIVKRVKRADETPHGGAWKVAYADFVTAMMAFFLVMWLIAAVSKDQRAAIFEYFKNPSMEQGKSVRPAPGQMGPGGASTSVINLGGGLDARRSATPVSTGLGTPRDQHAQQDLDGSASLEQARKITAEAERKKLESLMVELRQAIDKSQALKPFKDQLLLDITPEGLRIQIVDAQNRPMFDLGSAKLKGYTAEILHELAPYLNTVPNRLSLSGHTDTTPYTARAGYNNWDLSADRANAARRALEAGGLAPGKIARVVGLSSSVLFNSSNPRAPINRRISIIVMTKQAEEAALKTEDAPPVSAAAAARMPAASPGTAAAPAEPAAAPAAAPGTAPPTATAASPAAAAMPPTAAAASAPEPEPEPAPAVAKGH